MERKAASGHPQTVLGWTLAPGVGPEYSGREVFALAARQERIWKGESMEISK